MKLSFRKVSFIVFLLLIAYGLFWVARLVWFRPADIDHFFLRSYFEQIEKQPELRVQAESAVIEGLSQMDLNFSSISSRVHRERMAQVPQTLEVLRGYSYDQLTPSQQVSYDLLEWQLNQELAGANYFYHDYLMAPGSGAHSRMMDFMCYLHPVRTDDEAAVYLRRIRGIQKHFRNLIGGMKARVNKGIILPKPLLQQTLKELQELVSVPPLRHPLYEAFAHKAVLADPTAFNESEAVEVLYKIESELRATVYPGYQKLIEYLETLLPSAPDTVGCWHLPEGEAYYAYALQRYAETDKSPVLIGEMGQKAVDSLQARVSEVAASIGVPFQGTVGAFLDSLGRLPDFHYPSTLAGQQTCLLDYHTILSDTRDKIIGAVEQEPQGRILRIFAKDSLPTIQQIRPQYLPPSLSGMRNASLYLAFEDPALHPRWRMRALAYGYGVPGTHWQQALQSENEALPLFRQLAAYPAFTGGWRLYSAHLAGEIGFYQDQNGTFPQELYSPLGHLQLQLLAAAMTVVDPGLHHHRWSREQALTYLRTHTGLPEAWLRAEVDDAIAFPGRACAPWLGFQRLLQLRQRVGANPGGGTPVQDFHQTILENGAMPLEIVELLVDRLLIE